MFSIVKGSSFLALATNQSPTTRDEALWKRVGESDRAAITTLYRRYYQLLYSYAVRLSRDDARSQDCIHDLFVHLWSRRATLAPVSNVRSYLLAAVRNRLFKQLRKENRIIVTDEDRWFDVEAVFSAEHLIIRQEEDEAQRQQLASALEGLTCRQKEVIYLQFYEGLSLTEIQERTALKYQSVKNLTYRALSKLRDALRKKVLEG